MARTKEGRMIQKQLKELVDRVDFNAKDGWKVFDWCKAATILKERDPHAAHAFLNKQRDTTRGRIWLNHQPCTEDDTLLASRWDTPMLEIDGVATECYVDPMQIEKEFQKERLPDGTVTILPRKAEWGMHTLWPDSALRILGMTTNEELYWEYERRAEIEQEYDEVQTADDEA